MPGRVFRSNAEEIRFYMEELLSDGNVHDMEDFKNYIKLNSARSQEFSTGMYAGSLRTLVENSNGKYEVVARGKYRLVGNIDTEVQSVLKEKVLRTLSDCCIALENSCTINILNLSEADLKVAREVSNIIRMINEKIETVENL